jgi:class 3 adenylate cyclase/tetratricopeptide (TPR) repeat protein
MDIGSWLRNLGLGQYEAAFCQNAIDDTVLLSVTAEDLKDLGVGVVGHRRKLLHAIASLRAEANSKVTSPNALGRTDRTFNQNAERRQVTVMFSDLVGSTALSARTDPEDLRDIIVAYHKRVAEIMRRFDGFVAQYLGDGVLVYFGYPQAHEDDAERAVRAGLELIRAVGALKARVSLQTRIGIATGLVVVGDLMDSGNAREHGIVGETPNLAARLQGLAEPNMVIIAQSTRKLLGNLFDLEDLGAKDLKGIVGPLRAWAVLRPSKVESRFEALHAAGVTALVGRDEESEVLLRLWTTAKSGEGQVALLSGEAGIGKSRLTAALLESITSETHTRVRYFCSPQFIDSALYPFISQLERAAGLATDDTGQAKLDKLDALLVRSSVSLRDGVLIVEMMSLPNDGRYPTLELSQQERRQRTLEALSFQVESLARQHPVLVVFEDAHWADPTSLEALGGIVNRIRSMRVLLIVTFRPEFQSSWIGQPHVTSLTINRLTERDVGAMMDCIIGDKLIPTSIRHDIVERTDGIPLFIEEMTKAVLEAESAEVAEQTVAVVPLPALRVPESLHASLMARLDRLGSAKEVAQIGAVIGREFSHDLLTLVARKPQAELRWALDRLVTAGLLLSEGIAPHATYLFKHALVQDAAYGTLLREPRRRLHALIAEAIETQFPDIVRSQPELLARHCTDAGLIEKAASLWGKAGQLSLARSANVEAIMQFTRALGQIASLPATPALRRDQIKLQVALMNALIPVKGLGALETNAAAERARQLIEQAEALGEATDDPLLLFSVLYSFWVGSLGTGIDAHLKLAAQFLARAVKESTTGPLMIGHRLMGISLGVTGNFVKALAHFDQALPLYDPAEHRPLFTRFGADSRVNVLSRRSEIIWMLGCPDAAAEDVERALNDAREIGHALTLMQALRDTCSTHALRGTYATASALTDELVALADLKDAPPWKATGMLMRGRLFALTGKAQDAIPMLTSGISALRSMGQTIIVPASLLHLAMAHAELCQFDDGRRCIREAIAFVEAAKAKWWEAEIYRIAGEIALRSLDAEAEAYFQRALMVAREQHAKSWELRAAMSMARLWRDQGKRDGARYLLASVYGWFTEGYDTLDLRTAKALLDALASTAA